MSKYAKSNFLQAEIQYAAKRFSVMAFLVLIFKGHFIAKGAIYEIFLE